MRPRFVVQTASISVPISISMPIPIPIPISYVEVSKNQGPTVEPKW